MRTLTHGLVEKETGTITINLSSNTCNNLYSSNPSYKKPFPLYTLKLNIKLICK